MRANSGINPVYLPDQHLCELGELLMVPGAMLKHGYDKTDVGLVLCKVPDKFTLNRGHISFFYNKLEYLEHRWAALRLECLNRNRSVECNIKSRIEPLRHIDEFYKNWQPTEKDSQIVRERIIEKIYQKPDWYRHYSRPISNIRLFCDHIMDGELYKV